MLNLRRRAARLSGTAVLIATGLVSSGCLSAPAPDLTYDRVDLSGEVFRIFCRRIAAGANPTDVSGERFYAICDGEAAPRKDDDARLSALVAQRPLVIETLDKVFGKSGDGFETFKEGELPGFLRLMVPFYDPPAEYVPAATRGLAGVLAQLVDPKDARAVKVLETVARLSARTGYRTPDNALGAVRALLTYPELDPLAKQLLAVVGEGGAAHDAFVHVLEAGALELADEPVAVADRDDTTLHTALALLLRPDARFAGASGPALVLRRDENGNALPTAAAGDAADMASPFPVADRTDDATRDAALSGLAMSQDGRPLYETFDASRTLLAALMRQTKTLIDRGGEERSALEYAAHGLKPLLGTWTAGQKADIGAADYAFSGPDMNDSPLLDLAHAASVLARYPETDKVLRLLTQLVAQNESAGMAVVYAGLRVDAIADEYPDAKLIGPEGEGRPHEMWDDVIAAGVRIAKRPAMVEALIRAFADPRSVANAKLLASWMRNRDEVSYPKSPSTNPADINGAVSVRLSDAVQRAQAPTGMNRSIWQRTLSLIHHTNGLKICNKEGAILKVQTNGLGELTFPDDKAGYKACALIEIPDALEQYMTAMIGKGSLSIKDEGAKMLAVLGEVFGITGSVGQIQEKESQITGFSDKPTPQSLARFLFAPRNKFLSDMFDPTPIREGVAIDRYEPNALFSVENVDPSITYGGKAQSFLTLGVPLIEAFDNNELRDGKVLKDGYAFGHLMSALHRHWPAPSDENCPAQVEEGREGCTQRLDPSGPFYAPQSNAVSYEELIARAFDDEDLVGHLQRATVALSNIKIDGEDGVTILGKFARVLLTEDAALRTRDGKSYTQTNLCVVATGAGGAPSCQGDVGRIVPTLTPLHLLADALHRFDLAFAEDAERLEAWHAGRSRLVDQLLTVDRGGSDGAYTYALHNRPAREILLEVLPWLTDRIAAHRAAGDLVAWSEGLAPRLEKVLGHPLTAGVVDLLDKFWDEPEASGAFTEVSAYVLDDEAHPEAFTGMLIAAADLLTLLDRDAALSPAIQFASLALAPNAFEAVDGKAQPDGKGSAAYAALQLTRKLVEADKTAPSTLSKLLRNLVHVESAERSPMEVLIDVVADTNRTEHAQPTEVSLSAEEDRAVFQQVQSFLADGDRGLERLYKVIQGRKAD